MAKRYIDTGFYKHPFTRGLKGSLKGLYSFIICDCSGSGIWAKDLEVASIYVGMPITENEWFECFVKTGKAIDLENGKFFFPDFIEHQYPKGLSETNPAHSNFILELKKYNLLDESLKPLRRPFEGSKVMVMEKVMVTATVNGKSNGKKESEKKEIIFPFESERFLEMWQHWKNYKAKDHKFKYVSYESEQAALSELGNMSTNEDHAIKIITQSMAKGWKGFFELKTTTEKNGAQGFTAQYAHDLMNKENQNPE